MKRKNRRRLGKSRTIKFKRGGMSALSILITFIVVYSLMHPAMAIGQQEAATEAGILIESEENEPEPDLSGKEVNAAVTAEEAAETAAGAEEEKTGAGAADKGIASDAANRETAAGVADKETAAVAANKETAAGVTADTGTEERTAAEAKTASGASESAGRSAGRSAGGGNADRADAAFGMHAETVTGETDENEVFLEGSDQSSGISVRLWLDKSAGLPAGSSLEVHLIPEKVKTGSSGKVRENPNYRTLYHTTEQLLAKEQQTTAERLTIETASYLSLDIRRPDGGVFVLPAKTKIQAEVTCPVLMKNDGDTTINVVQSDAHTAYDADAEDPSAEVMDYALHDDLSMKTISASYTNDVEHRETSLLFDTDTICDLGIVTASAERGEDQDAEETESGMNQSASGQDDDDQKIGDISYIVEEDDGESSEEQDGEVSSSADEQTPGTLTFNGADYQVTLTYGADAGIPADASLSVREVRQYTSEYKRLVSQYNETYPDAQKAALFDITILDGEGEELEPAAPVQVDIQMSELEKAGAEDVTLVHFDSDIEEIDSEVYGDTLSFEADSFSVYGIFYTVDFHYEINGKTVEFSIPGGGFVSLEHVVEVLGIALTDTNAEKDPKEAAQEFVAEVADVQFSSPELVWVGKVEEDTTVGAIKEALGLECEYSAELTEEEIAEINAQTVEAGDWALISLKPFTSEESLTVTMKNGDQFVVRVTDAQLLADGVYVMSSQSGGQYRILQNDGTVAYSSSIDINSIPDTYKWDVVCVDVNTNTYKIYGVGTSNYLSLDSGVVSSSEDKVVLSGSGNVFKINSDSNGNYLKWSERYYAGNNGKERTMTFTRVGDIEDNTNKFTVNVSPSNAGTITIGDDAPTTSGKAAIKTGGDFKGTNDRQIKATANSGYVFSHWELDGNTLEGYTNEIKGGTLPVQEGQNLVAVFQQSSTGGGQGHENDYDFAAEVKAWKEEMLKKQPYVDKKASVYDYDNRIYQLEMDVSSALRAAEKDIDIVFVADISRSMYFPAKIEAVSSFSSASDLITQLEALDSNADTKQNVYYLIGNPSSDSTVYAVRKKGGVWEWIDASYDIEESGYKKDAPGSGLAKEWNTLYNLSSTSYGAYNTTDIWGNTSIMLKTNTDSSKYKVLEQNIYIATDTKYRLDYLEQAVELAGEVVFNADQNARIGLVTFADKVYSETKFFNKDTFGTKTSTGTSTLMGTLNDITPKGGTNQKAGIDKANDFWNTPSDSSKQRAVMVITDGAPNPGTWGG